MKTCFNCKNVFVFQRCTLVHTCKQVVLWKKEQKQSFLEAEHSSNYYTCLTYSFNLWTRPNPGSSSSCPILLFFPQCFLAGPFLLVWPYSCPQLFLFPFGTFMVLWFLFCLFLLLLLVFLDVHVSCVELP